MSTFDTVKAIDDVNENKDDFIDKNEYSNLLKKLDENLNTKSSKKAIENMNLLKNKTKISVQVLKNRVEDKMFWHYLKYKTDIKNISSKYSISYWLFTWWLKWENSSANIYAKALTKPVIFDDVNEWKNGAYWLWQITKGTLKSIYDNYLNNEFKSKFTSFNDLKSKYLWIWIQDSETVKIQLECSAAFMKHIIDTNLSWEDRLTPWKVLSHYNAWLSFESGYVDKWKNAPESYISWNLSALNLDANLTMWYNELTKNSTISAKEYLERMENYYNFKAWSLDWYIKNIRKQIGWEEWMEKIHKNAEQELIDLWYSPRETTVWWIWQLSIWKVLWMAFAWFQWVAAIMNWFSWNWWDVIKNLTVLYWWYAMMKIELWWTVENFKKEIDRRAEDAEEYWSDKDDVEKVLNKIYWNNWDKRKEYFEAFFDYDENNTVWKDFVENRKFMFTSVDFTKLQDWNLSPNWLKELFGSDYEEFEWKSEKNQKKIIDWLKLLKRDWVKDKWEFNASMDYLLFTANKNMFKTLIDNSLGKL